MKTALAVSVGLNALAGGYFLMTNTDRSAQRGDNLAVPPSIVERQASGNTCSTLDNNFINVLS